MTKSKQYIPKPPSYYRDETLVRKTGVVAGYDPGVAGCAFVVILDDASTPIEYVFSNKKGTTEFEAARKAAVQFKVIHLNRAPDVLVIERPFLKFNPRVQFQLDFIVGYVACAAEQLGTQVRIALVRNARAATHREKPTSKGSVKDIEDATTFALYARLMLGS